MLKIAAILLLLIACGAAALFLAGPERLWRQLGQVPPSLDLREWPGRASPNWALSCPALPDGTSYCKGTAPTHASPVFAVEAKELFDWMIGRILAEPMHGGNSEAARNYSAVTVLERDDQRHKIRFELLTLRMKYPDIVDLDVIELPDGNVSFAILSQSLIGLSDLGKNAHFVARLTKDAVDRFGRH